MKLGKSGCLIVLSAGVIGLGSYAILEVASESNLPLLIDEHGAQWIRFAEPVFLPARPPGRVATSFRTRFTVPSNVESAFLIVRAMKSAHVYLDDVLLVTSDQNFENWKTPLRFDLGPRITPGAHELRIAASNWNGPATVLAYAPRLNLFTGPHWEASRDGKTWSRAMPVDEPAPTEMSRRFPRVDRALLSNLIYLLPFFGLVFLLTVAASFSKAPIRRLNPSPIAGGAICAAVLLLWLALAMNNFYKLPVHVGFDVPGHVTYIRTMAATGRIPLPDEGWKSSEPPLYYALAAILYRLLFTRFDLETTIRFLRLISIGCGAAQVVISYFVLRYAFPRRNDLQAIGTVIGGLLPMNLYISQGIGNEAMAGCLAGIVIMLGFSLIPGRSGVSVDRRLAAMGFVLGLSILTKVTAVLLFPPLLLHLFYLSRRDRWSRPSTYWRFSLVILVPLAVAGWYFVRNWFEVGSPFVGGWEKRGSVIWWQDPGYRTLSHFARFGEALVYPVHAAAVGLWDSLYSTFWMDGSLSGTYPYDHRPPWNYDFMLSGAWLALVPSVGILLGILAALLHPAKSLRSGTLFSSCCVLVYALAIIGLYLKVPTYSTAKSTYTLGLTSCYAVLAVSGFQLLSNSVLRRGALYGFLACWSLSTYLAYFIR